MSRTGRGLFKVAGFTSRRCVVGFKTWGSSRSAGPTMRQRVKRLGKMVLSSVKMGYTVLPDVSTRIPGGFPCLQVFLSKSCLCRPEEFSLLANIFIFALSLLTRSASRAFLYKYIKTPRRTTRRCVCSVKNGSGFRQISAGRWSAAAGMGPSRSP